MEACGRTRDTWSVGSPEFEALAPIISTTLIFLAHLRKLRLATCGWHRENQQARAVANFLSQVECLGCLYLTCRRPATPKSRVDHLPSQCRFPYHQRISPGKKPLDTLSNRLQDSFGALTNRRNSPEALHLPWRNARGAAFRPASRWLDVVGFILPIIFDGLSNLLATSHMFLAEPLRSFRDRTFVVSDILDRETIIEGIDLFSVCQLLTTLPVVSLQCKAS